MIKCKPYIDSSIHSHHVLSQNKSHFPLSVSSSSRPVMVPEMEKPRVTEIRVRMDCNGCVQKIKKALHGITGIYELYIDFPQQKITIIGWAEPEKIVKAIKKTRKSAIICSHAEQPDQQAQETEGVPEGGPAEGGAPPPESTNPQAEQPPAEAVPPEAPQESPPPPENPPPEEKPGNETSQAFQFQPSKPNQPEEIHVIHHHPPDYGYRYAYGHYHQQSSNPTGLEFRGEPPQPLHVIHSYNTYKPSPYVTEYAYLHSPPGYMPYSRPEQYSQVYYSGNNGNGSGNGNITSMFSEENPNACSIV